MRGLETAAADVFPAVPNRAFPKKYVKKRYYFYNQITLYQKDRCKRNDGAAVSIATGLFLCYILGMHTK